MRTSDFGLKFAAKPCKQKTAVAADKWGGANTPVLGAGDQFLGELDVDDSPEFWKDESRNGTQFASGQEITMVKADVNGKFPMYVEGVSHLLTCILGWEDLEGPVAAGANYSHLICLNPNGKDVREFTTAEQAKITGHAAGDLYNTHLTFGRLEGPSEIVVRNVQVAEFTISGAQKEPVRVEFSGVGENALHDENKATSPNWSLPANSFDMVYHIRHCTVSKMGPVAGMLDVKLLDFTIKGKFGVASDNQSTRSGQNREYPYSDGLSELTFEATVFLHDTEVYKTWEQSQAAIAVKLVFTRGAKSMSIMVPSLRVKSAKPEVSNGGSVKVSGEMFAFFGADPFVADHPSQVIDFPTPLMLQIVDSSNVNGLRKN